MVKTAKKELAVVAIRGLEFFLVGLFLAIFSLTVAFFLIFSGKIYPGVSVENIDLGRKTTPEGKTALKTALAPRFPEKITLVKDKQVWEIRSASVSAEINYQKTIEQAFSYGRKGTIIGNIQAIVQALFFGYSTPLSVDINEDELAKNLTNIAYDTDVLVEEPTISLEPASKKVNVTAGKDGSRLQIEENINTIKLKLANLDNSPLPLVIYPVKAKVSQEVQEETRARAENLLAKTMRLTGIEPPSAVTGDQLVTLVSFTDAYDRDRVASLAASLASRVDRAPQDAVIQFEGNKVKIFRPSQEGMVLDQTNAIVTLMTSLKTLEATESSTLSVQLPMISQPPKITTESVNNLGIKERIGHGVSYFRGSIASRIHNIILASSKVNGTLVPPGETFSFAQAVGDISAATGYQQAYIIEKGRTVLGDGGGTCQVSTTLFRAIIDAGLPVEERHAHAYRVAYYEQGGWAPGFDATVFVPNIDLKFKNDTPTYILVQAEPDAKTATLIFDLYGTKDGRKVTISRGRTWNPQPAPPERYEDDPTLPKGVVKQVDWAAAGLQAAFDYEVTKGDGVVQKKTFYSNFRPWQAVYLRGTGG